MRQITTVAVWPTRAEIEQWLTGQGLTLSGGSYHYAAGEYELGCDEYAPPRYSIRAYRGGYAVHRKTYYYAGALRSLPCGYLRRDICLTDQHTLRDFW